MGVALGLPSPPIPTMNTHALQAHILREIVVTRCLNDWLKSEWAKGIVVDAPEALDMHRLMEKVIRAYQEEVLALLATASSAKQPHAQPPGS
jgi:hypothetical protein